MYASLVVAQGLALAQKQVFRLRIALGENRGEVPRLAARAFKSIALSLGDSSGLADARATASLRISPELNRGSAWLVVWMRRMRGSLVDDQRRSSSALRPQPEKPDQD